MAWRTPSFPPMRCCGGVHGPSTERRIEDWFIDGKEQMNSEGTFPTSVPITNSSWYWICIQGQRPLSIIFCRCHVRDPPGKGTGGRKGLEMPTPHIWFLGPLILSPKKGHRKRKKNTLFIYPSGQATVTSNNKVDECPLPIVICPFQLCKAWHSGWHCTNAHFYKFCPLHLVRLKKEKFIYSVCRYTEWEHNTCEYENKECKIHFIRTLCWNIDFAVLG